jgi:uncharacterized protein
MTSFDGAESCGRSDDVTVQFDVPARMRDGAVLRANVYRPAGEGPWPTLLARTPYDKDDTNEISWCGLDPVQAARRGFMVVIQDCRGRFASEGEWDPYGFERADGFDSVEWAATLPGSNGRIGMYSGSYCGNTQWLAAMERPPSLAAISPAMTWSEPLDGLFARGGAVELGLGLFWPLLTGLGDVGRRADDELDAQQRFDAVVRDCDLLGAEGYWELPIRNSGVSRRHGIPDPGGIRALDVPDVIGLSRVAGAHEALRVPTFHTAGWYDLFLQGTLDNYQAMATSGSDARLVVGPWTHLTFADPIGERVFGLRAGRDGFPAHDGRSWNDLQLGWLRSQLEPGCEEELPSAPVRIFVMGRNEWRDEWTWPLPRAVTERWFLHPDASLAPTPPDVSEGSTGFVYDPGNPVPTLGGHTVLSGYPAGSMDQARVEGRADVLVYTSAPLREDMEVTGRVRVVLRAQSSARSTDWVARLCDVDPAGRSFNICDGISRVTRDADACKSHAIDLWSTSNVFLRGHRFRVHVTSSSFPRWDRNLNTGDQESAHHTPAHQRITYDRENPSYIELPVVR